MLHLDRNNTAVVLPEKPMRPMKPMRPTGKAAGPQSAYFVEKRWDAEKRCAMWAVIERTVDRAQGVDAQTDRHVVSTEQMADMLAMKLATKSGGWEP